MDLARPANGSVNDGIPKELCSLKYITVDLAIERIWKMGCRTFLVKIDKKCLSPPTCPPSRSQPFINEMGLTYIP